MTLRTYDERDLVTRLSALDRTAKAAFAASCAQRLLPLFERYAISKARLELHSQLGSIVDSVWQAADSGSVDQLDMPALQAAAEAMVPFEGDVWTLETGYGQNAAAAAAYAVRTWLTDDAQEAGWAARQVYELADYAVLQSNLGLDLNAPGSEARVLESRLVQRTLEALARTLDAVEAAPSSWRDLRTYAEAEGRTLAEAAP